MSENTTTSSATYTPLSQLLGFEKGDFVTIATNKVQRAKTVSVDDLDIDYAMGLFDKQDTWIGAQPVKPSTPDKRTKASDVAALRVLYADFDYKDGADAAAISRAIHEISTQIGANPVSIVNSGGGLHPRWKLAKAIEPADAKGVLGRWQITVQRIAEENGFKADSVFDLPRVLRLPGTVNEKYDPPVLVTISASGLPDTVSTAAVWSKLDQHQTKLSQKKTAPPADHDSDIDLSQVPTEAPPAKPDPSGAVMNERYVNSELTKCAERLHKLQVDGYDGEPWHNTVRDVAFVMAKIGMSPETAITIDEVEQMFRNAAPSEDDYDKKDDWDRDVDTAWESACEAAEGEVFEMVGSGDEIYSDDFSSMLSGVESQSSKPLDIDPSIDLSSVGDPTPADAPLGSASERYETLGAPLVPGFNGPAALRVLDLPENMPLALENRLTVIGEDIADLHIEEHEEYLHPHCPACFPSSWKRQLYRWGIRNPGKDSTSFHPPLGRVAPGEGYLDGLSVLGMSDSEMMVEGFIPAGGVGILAGRNGAGKTFMALDIAMNVLNPDAQKWALTDIYAEESYGEIADHGGVMFFAGEGFKSMKSRVQAWLQHNGHGDKPDSAPGWVADLDMRGEVPNFFTGGEDYDKMLERVARTKPRLVVIDTLQKAAAGSDQNSASDMAIVHDNLARLKSVVDGLTVMVLAHSTKDDMTVRGSSALEDDADFVMHAKKGGGSNPNVLEVTKSRDSEKPAPLDYYLAPVGKSVAISSTKSSNAHSMAGERDKVDLLNAMNDLRLAQGDGADLSITDIVSQTRIMAKPDVYTMLAHDLIPNALVVGTSAAGNKYQMTPKGVQWLESRDAAVFARSKGLK